ncbi:hypothetical protein CRG98_020579 [Punica granatum]|uniref:Uncharacterized protein n=1 Tax=Punica granatum TaxID=22663 RepID=A0A2I0JS00_PUNGR|nr:hypothetical protein CRG98_020579 [Punica granatum]
MLLTTLHVFHTLNGPAADEARGAEGQIRETVKELFNDRMEKTEAEEFVWTYPIERKKLPTIRAHILNQLLPRVKVLHGHAEASSSDSSPIPLMEQLWCMEIGKDNFNNLGLSVFLPRLMIEINSILASTLFLDTRCFQWISNSNITAREKLNWTEKSTDGSPTWRTAIGWEISDRSEWLESKVNGGVVVVTRGVPSLLSESRQPNGVARGPVS